MIFQLELATSASQIATACFRETLTGELMPIDDVTYKKYNKEIEL